MANLIDQSLLNKARTDKFILAMNTPKCLRDTSTKTARSTNEKSYKTVMPDAMQYSIYGSVVPAVNIPSIEVPQYGQTVRVSSHNRNAYDDVTVNFTIDNEFNNYWYIWRWLDILNDSNTAQYDAMGVSTSRPSKPFTNADRDDSRGIGRPNPAHPDLMMDYQTDMTLLGLNEYNKNTISFTYTKAFPVTLGNIDYSYREPSEIESSFSFSFSQLLVELL